MNNTGQTHWGMPPPGPASLPMGHLPLVYNYPQAPPMPMNQNSPSTSTAQVQPASTAATALGPPNATVSPSRSTKASICSQISVNYTTIVVSIITIVLVSLTYFVAKGSQGVAAWTAKKDMQIYCLELKDKNEALFNGSTSCPTAMQASYVPLPPVRRWVASASAAATNVTSLLIESCRSVTNDAVAVMPEPALSVLTQILSIVRQTAATLAAYSLLGLFSLLALLSPTGRSGRRFTAKQYLHHSVHLAFSLTPFFGPYGYDPAIKRLVWPPTFGPEMSTAFTWTVLSLPFGFRLLKILEFRPRSGLELVLVASSMVPILSVIGIFTRYTASTAQHNQVANRM